MECIKVNLTNTLKKNLLCAKETHYHVLIYINHHVLLHVSLLPTSNFQVHSMKADHSSRLCMKKIVNNSVESDLQNRFNLKKMSYLTGMLMLPDES